MEVSARKNSGIQDALDTLIKLWMNGNNSALRLTMPKFDDKNIQKNGKKSLLKRENRDCVIM